MSSEIGWNDPWSTVVSSSKDGEWLVSARWPVGAVAVHWDRQRKSEGCSQSLQEQDSQGLAG